MMFWFAAGLLVLIALLLLWKRAQAAQLQGLVMGGRMTPGCSVAEAIALILVAIALVVLQSQGFFR